MKDTTTSRIESELEVQSYIQNLRYALQHGAEITFQEDRLVDQKRDPKNTNKFTVADLFPDEDPKDVLRRELQTLTVEEYIRTVRDIRYPKRSEMREFGKVYAGKGDVFIKVRVELLSAYGKHSTFVMSFHYAERPLALEHFPYQKSKEVSS